MIESFTVQVGAHLREKGYTVGTAESCTGGLIASILTDISGSSAYVMGGIVAYDNSIKQVLLNVREATLIEHGAVSEPVAEQMATGARQKLGVDFALSVTGIAGPGGGTEEKRVGLTYIGLAGPDDLLVVERHVWSGTRIENKQHSANAALALLLRHIASS